MIIKFFQIDQIKLKQNKNNLILFYGKNEGLKKKTIKDLIKNEKGTTFNYEEKEIIDNQILFIENLLTRSLFETKKIIIIKRVTDKIINFIDEIKTKNLDDILIILDAENLEKKSKLRSNFEKDKNYICVAFYPDNEQTLSKLAFSFFREKNITISQENINLIVSRSNGDRENLYNELNKIESFSKNGKTITKESILKLSNLNENYAISELIDYCFAKNKKKILHILNENNFNNDDSIIIARTFLNKSKKILKLLKEFENNKDLDLTISNAKPPIFWKEKEITKIQLMKWKSSSIKKAIYKLNDIELQIKKNLSNSIHAIIDFIIYQSSSKPNN